MQHITFEQFHISQPCYPETKLSDKYYFNLTNRLLDDWSESGLFPKLHDSVKQRVALCVVGYYQDILSDAGLWRGFISECRRKYRRPVPFHDEPDDYVDFELNYIDVAFMIWYAIAMLDLNHRLLFPLHNDVLALARIWFDRLDRCYDDAPLPEEYNIGFQLDIKDPEDRPLIARFSHWLFNHSYLLTPAFALTTAQMYQQAEPEKEGAEIRMREMLDEAMTQQPTGPLALFLGEWLYLILHDRLPADEQPEVAETHKYFSAVTEMHGRDILYFADYKSLNEFFINTLGWEAGESHLPQMKNDRDFAIMVTPRFGMLVAKNVARFIADPVNPLYNKAYARRNAINLITVRGLCPPDLLKRILAEGWLPDAAFPDADNDNIAPCNEDFIARCYLQLYYTGD
ncbi:MAG: DUF3843 family protein [Muribaculaceae bacterium]|nr:DUF3843 family protein [Muribaculaceae bacterium]